MKIILAPPRLGTGHHFSGDSAAEDLVTLRQPTPHNHFYVWVRPTRAAAAPGRSERSTRATTLWVLVRNRRLLAKALTAAGLMYTHHVSLRV